MKLEENTARKAMYRHPQGGPYFDYLELVKRNFDPQVRQPPLRHGALDPGRAVEHGVDDHVGSGRIHRRIRLEGRAGREGRTGDGGTAGRAAARGATAGGAGRGQAGAAGDGGRRRRREALRAALDAAAAADAGADRSTDSACVQVPVGTGMIDFALAARAAEGTSTSTARPNVEPEWTGLGGAESGRDTLTLPRETVIGLLKRDYETIKAALGRRRRAAGTRAAPRGRLSPRGARRARRKPRKTFANFTR